MPKTLDPIYMSKLPGMPKLARGLLLSTSYNFDQGLPAAP